MTSPPGTRSRSRRTRKLNDISELKDLCWKLAAVAAVRKDIRNVRKADLKPEYQDYWL